jgi:hypothetical protein
MAPWSLSAVPQTPTAPPATPTANLAVSDPSTIAAVLTVVAAVVVNAWPNLNLAPFVPALSIVVAGLVASAVMFSKHHYAAGIAQATGAAAAAAAAVPKDAPPDLRTVVELVDRVHTTLQGMVDGGVAPPVQ